MYVLKIVIVDIEHNVPKHQFYLKLLFKNYVQMLQN